MKQFGVVSGKDLHAIQIATILILFWVGVWNLTEEVLDKIQQKYNIIRWKLYAGLVLFVLLIIILDPHTFEKL
jgi:hypothetical protein